MIVSSDVSIVVVKDDGDDLFLLRYPQQELPVTGSPDAMFYVSESEFNHLYAVRDGSIVFDTIRQSRSLWDLIRAVGKRDV
jgi:hypothetical protein